jgi:hypothetical protein
MVKRHPYLSPFDTTPEVSISMVCNLAKGLGWQDIAVYLKSKVYSEKYPK